jgi:hypothetical protein
VERQKTESVSDGRLEIFDDFAARWAPVEELAPGEHLVLDTTGPAAQTVAELRGRLPSWPEGMND